MSMYNSKAHIQTRMCALHFKGGIMENEKKENVEVVPETNNEQVKDENKDNKTKENESLSSIVLELKTQHDNEIKALKDAYGKEIAERDSVIKQLLSDSNTATNHETIVDKINKKRNFKKW